MNWVRYCVKARDQNILGVKPALIPSDNISKAFAPKYITAGKAAKKSCILFCHKPCQVRTDLTLPDCQPIKTNYFLDQIATVFVFKNDDRIVLGDKVLRTQMKSGPNVLFHFESCDVCRRNLHNVYLQRNKVVWSESIKNSMFQN